MRRWDQSLVAFREVPALSPGDQDDTRFRIWLIRARRGERQAATAELRRYLKGRKAEAPEEWPLNIGAFLSGEMPEKDRLKAAEAKDS